MKLTQEQRLLAHRWLYQIHHLRALWGRNDMLKPRFVIVHEKDPKRQRMWTVTLKPLDDDFPVMSERYMMCKGGIERALNEQYLFCRLAAWLAIHEPPIGVKPWDPFDLPSVSRA